MLPDLAFRSTYFRNTTHSETDQKEELNRKTEKYL